MIKYIYGITSKELQFEVGVFQEEMNRRLILRNIGIFKKLLLERPQAQDQNGNRRHSQIIKPPRRNGFGNCCRNHDNQCWN